MLYSQAQMMDYEFRITLLEKELAHLKEMQALMRAREDTADAGFGRIEEILAHTVQNLDTLTGVVATLSGKIDALVAALLREHPNGQ